MNANSCNIKVVKFGGSSLADAEHFEKVKDKLQKPLVKSGGGTCSKPSI